MTVTLKSTNRNVTLSTSNEDHIREFIEWLNSYHRYISHNVVGEENVYTFSKDAEVFTSTIKAKRIGLVIK